MRSEEVAEAVGEGDLGTQIAALEADLATPTPRDTKTARLAELKRKKAEQDAAAVVAEAKARLLGIQRALGSLGDQSKLDNNRLLDAARKFADQIESTNERFEKCLALRHEAAALAEVFGLPMPDLPTITVPALRAEVQAAFEITSSVGVRDNGFVQAVRDNDGHRTYEDSELAGSPGLALIQRKLGK